MEKEDGSRLLIGDVANFQVIEFSKENRRILVSHTITWRKEVSEKKKMETKATQFVSRYYYCDYCFYGN